MSLLFYVSFFIIIVMDKANLLKETAQKFGLKAKDLVNAWLLDGWLKAEDLYLLVPELLKRINAQGGIQALYEVAKNPQAFALKDTEPVKAESGLIDVGMYYYAEDKTFSKALLANKIVSGVVGSVDETYQHGLVALLHQGYYSLMDGELKIFFPERANGKENTDFILRVAQHGKIKANAAQYCVDYAFDGIKAGEAFLPSKYELAAIGRNYQLINDKLVLIDDADLLPRGNYFSSSMDNGSAHNPYAITYPSCRKSGVDYRVYNACRVLPVIAF